MKPSIRPAHASSPIANAKSQGIKLGMALLLALAADRANAGEIWIPATTAGTTVEFVTLDYRPDVSALSSGMFDTRIEIGLHNDTNTYTLTYWSGSESAARNLATFESLNQARESSTPVNILVEGDSREVHAIRIGATGHPLAVRRVKGAAAGFPASGGDAIRFDALGRNLAKPKAMSKPRTTSVTGR